MAKIDLSINKPVPNVDEIVDQRGGIYGHPYDNFDNIGRLWAAYITSKHHQIVDITREDVAYMMILLKVARSMYGVYSADTPDDIAGYAKCVKMIEERKKEPVS